MDDRWIPCEERLPDKPGKYLVTKNNKVYTIMLLILGMLSISIDGDATFFLFTVMIGLYFIILGN